MTPRQLAAVDGYLFYNGLEISFETSGKEELLELDMDGSLDLLQAAGLIEYKNGVIMFEDRPHSWSDFVDYANLGEEDYRKMVLAYKNRRVCERIMAL